MDRSSWRPFSWAVTAVFVLLTVALLARAPWAISGWPWAEAPITFVFLASIAAAVAAAWFAVALGDEPAALAGIALNVVVTSSGAGLFLGWLLAAGRAGTQPSIRVGLALAVVSLAFGVWLWTAARRLPLRDTRPMPRLDRWAFGAFTVTLIVAGAPLAAQIQVFPWQFAPPSATVTGWIFLGAATYFGHAVVKGQWAYAVPPYFGFLVYDIILFVPYSRMLAPGADVNLADDYGPGAAVNMVSLAIFMTVLTASTLLALHAFVVRPSTRVFARAALAGRH